jgi:hypothetical protein
MQYIGLQQFVTSLLLIYCILTLSLLLLLQEEEDVVVGSARSGDFSAAVAEAEAAYNNSTGALGLGQPMVPLRCAYTVCY